MQTLARKGRLMQRDWPIFLSLQKITRALGCIALFCRGNGLLQFLVSVAVMMSDDKWRYDLNDGDDDTPDPHHHQT